MGRTRLCDGSLGGKSSIWRARSCSRSMAEKSGVFVTICSRSWGGERLHAFGRRSASPGEQDRCRYRTSTHNSLRKMKLWRGSKITFFSTIDIEMPESLYLL